MNIQSIAESARNLLTGEPLRAITYGAVAVVYLVSKASVALGFTADTPDFDGIAIAVTAAIAAVTEVARRFTFSSNTVERAIGDAFEGGLDAWGQADGGVVGEDLT